MDKKSLLRIQKWIGSQKNKIIEDLRGLVEIPSVSEKNPEIKPYGEPCRKALDYMLDAAQGYGFDSANYFYHVGSVNLNHPAFADGMVGIWVHLDVAPPGDNWSFPPFSLTQKNGFFIGRGVLNNKCAAVGMLHAFRCLNSLFSPLKHEYVLYMRCSRENSMDDIQFFMSHYQQPELSLITDNVFSGYIRGNGFDSQSGTASEQIDLFHMNMKKMADAPDVKEARRVLRSDSVISFRCPSSKKRIYKEFPNDLRGGYRQANESVYIEDFFNAIFIYVCSILALDQRPLKKHY